MKRTFIWLAAYALTVVFAAGQTVPDRYIVELNGDPAVLSALSVKRSQREAAMSQRRQAIRQEHRRMRSRLRAERAEVIASVENVANALIVRAPGVSRERLSRIPGVLRVHPVRLHKRYMDRAVGVVRASDAWAMIGGNLLAGAGQRIGVIDSGIDPAHPAFQDPDLRAPEGFPIVNDMDDLAWTSAKVIVARDYDSEDADSTAKPTDGHGTAVAMVAAGMPVAGPYGIVSGVAPKAYLGSYKVFPDGSDGAPDDYIIKAIDDAVADHMDVINLSLGSTFAERAERDPLAMAVERASANGMIVVVAAGNEGPGAMTVGSPGGAPSAITVGNAANDRTFGTITTVDGIGALNSEVPAEMSGFAPVAAPLADVAAFDGNGLGCSAYPASALQAKIAFILRGDCTFEEKINLAERAGAVGVLVYTDEDRPEPIPMYTGSARLPAAMVSYGDGIRIKKELESRPGLTATLSFSTSPLPGNPWVLSGSSSRGPSAEMIKPDLVAVGSTVTTAWLGSAFRVVNGTSFASPMVAGAAALLKAARPGMPAHYYRSLLVNSTTAFGPRDSVQPMRLQQAGAGELNVAAALTSTLISDPVSISFGVGGPSLSTWRTLAFTNIAGEKDTFTIEVTPMSGAAAPYPRESSFELGPGQTTWVPMSFVAHGMTPGEYQGIIRLRSARGTELRVPYWYGISSGKAKEILVLNEPDADVTRSSRNTQYIWFRGTDENGIRVLEKPEVTVIAGEGRVLDVVNADDDVPGAFVAELRIGVGTNTFEVRFGEVAKTFTIRGR